MTNAEKILKDKASIDEVAKAFEKFCMDFSNFDTHTYSEEMREFLKAEAKPTLTEDERVILRNIDKKYKCIGRTDYDAKIQYLYVNIEDGWKPHIMQEFDHLFQFIKERRRI